MAIYVWREGGTRWNRSVNLDSRLGSFLENVETSREFRSVELALVECTALTVLYSCEGEYGAG